MKRFIPLYLAIAALAVGVPVVWVAVSDGDPAPFQESLGNNEGTAPCQGPNPGPQCTGIPCRPVAEIPAVPIASYARAKGHTVNCQGYFYTFALRLEDNQGHASHYTSGTATGNIAPITDYIACQGPRLVRSFFYIQVNGQSFYSSSPFKNCP